MVSLPSLCEEKGCNSPSDARGLCHRHYYARRKAGTLPDRRRQVNEGSECGHEGCKRASRTRGLCGRHYNVARRTGEFATALCAVPHCSRGSISKGLCQSHSQRASKYGLSVDDLVALDSVDACEVCGGPPDHVDHDHVTGLVRGVLCQPCNNALGLLKDDQDRLYALILYLDRFKDAQP